MTEQNEKVSLSSLLTPSKTVAVDFPALEGFTVSLCYLAREELIKLRARCVSQKLNRKTRGFEETLDEDKFLTEYCKAVIKGWKGLKYKYLEEKYLYLILRNQKVILQFTVKVFIFSKKKIKIQFYNTIELNLHLIR